MKDKGIFINYKIFKGLFDKAYNNYKKRDYDTRYNLFNIFKKIVEE